MCVCGVDGLRHCCRTPQAPQCVGRGGGGWGDGGVEWWWGEGTTQDNTMADSARNLHLLGTEGVLSLPTCPCPRSLVPPHP